jgi:uncharacterized glyoxalase superfamily protein PhnB
MIETISAITLATNVMARAVRFYEALEFEIVHGGKDALFTSFRGESADRHWSWRGCAIFYVSDVDAFYDNVVAKGHRPETALGDSEWGERFFHLTDPDGHELSFARLVR